MKILFVSVLFALVSFTLFSRDITTLSGTSYKNAKVYASNPAELVISYKNASGWTILKSVPFTDLPDSIRKEYEYEPAKGQAYARGLNDWEMKNAEEKAAAAKQRKIDEKLFEQNVKKMMQEQQQEAMEREKLAIEKKNNPKAVNEDALSTYANQLDGNVLTDMQKGQLWRDIQFKEVESSGTVTDVSRMDDSSMTLVPGEDVIISHDNLNAWQVRIFNPNYPKSMGVFILVYNYDIAKNLSRGQHIKFKGTIWRFNDNRIYLNPSSILN
jgi:hypothetical protein